MKKLLISANEPRNVWSLRSFCLYFGMSRMLAAESSTAGMWKFNYESQMKKLSLSFLSHNLIIHGDSSLWKPPENFNERGLRLPSLRNGNRRFCEPSSRFQSFGSWETQFSHVPQPLLSKVCSHELFHSILIQCSENIFPDWFNLLYYKQIICRRTAHEKLFKPSFFTRNFN